jgi:trehalose 6-phosphate phosphatase
LSLWQHLQAVLQHLLAHEWCALLCDYDGTLAPIVADPATVRLSPAIHHVLTTLAHHPHYRVAIVSGRSLTDLRARVDGMALYLAGNHGLEIVGPGVAYCHPGASRLQPQLATLAQALRHDLEEIPGAWIEDKGLTLTVHFRSVPERFVPLVRRRVLRRVCPALETGGLALRTGKAVLEVRPHVQWGKGEAVRWIIEHMRLERPAARGCTVYMGDDETDEDAFRALDTAGLGIVVGNRLYSVAHYGVESVEQTTQFLAVLNALTWPTVRREKEG